MELQRELSPVATVKYFLKGTDEALMHAYRKCLRRIAWMPEDVDSYPIPVEFSWEQIDGYIAATLAVGGTMCQVDIESIPGIEECITFNYVEDVLDYWTNDSEGKISSQPEKYGLPVGVRFELM